MQLIVISNSESVPQEAQIINHLFEAGMGCFHLRKPGSSAEEVQDLLAQINPENHSKIALHQHHFLADKNSIKRLHFTEQARGGAEPEELQQLKEQDFTLSTSIHQVEMISDQLYFDYVFLSPVFNSISKAGYKGFANPSFTMQKTVSKPKVIALGGIDASNIRQLKTMNFDGAAVLGSIWQQPELALYNFKQLHELCLKSSMPVSLMQP